MSPLSWLVRGSINSCYLGPLLSRFTFFLKLDSSLSVSPMSPYVLLFSLCEKLFGLKLARVGFCCLQPKNPD